jgi:hypothetical protein
VQNELSVDACARTFALRDTGALDTVRRLLSGSAVSIVGSQAGLGQQLCSPALELELSLAKPDRLDLTSLDLSRFSVEALDDILAEGSFSVVSEDDLLKKLLNLGEDYVPLLRRIAIEFLSTTGLAIMAEHFVFPPEWVCCAVVGRFLHPPPPPLPSGWDSVIVADFPEIFNEFRNKRFSLLWRGSRDSFRVDAFHGRCDRHPNTLTVILDTDGNIFGGFTPVAWDRISDRKGDPSGKSFLFTLKNPHNVAPRKFALRPEKKCMAITCWPGWGPHFNDIAISNDPMDDIYNTKTRDFGQCYTNDTGLEGRTFFTGSPGFRAMDIEVFQISN